MTVTEEEIDEKVEELIQEREKKALLTEFLEAPNSNKGSTELESFSVNERELVLMLNQSFLSHKTSEWFKERGYRIGSVLIDEEGVMHLSVVPEECSVHEEIGEEPE